MEYYVRYGFGKDEEQLRTAFLESSESIVDDNIVVYAGVCFSSYAKQRLNLEGAYESDVYYSLSCNKDMLDELVKWLNSLKAGFNITIEKGKKVEELVGTVCRYVDFTPINEMVDFKFGKPFMRVSSKTAKEKNITGLPIGRYAIRIHIDDSTDIRAKTILEYLLLVTIRILDYKEGFITYMEEEGTIINRVLKASDRDWGHSIYCGIDKLPEKNLKICLNMSNVTSFTKENKYYSVTTYRQTDYIQRILTHVKDKGENN